MSGTSAPDLTASLSSAGKRIAIVAARFNQDIVQRLVDGAYQAIVATGGNVEQVTLLHCPGAWELPQVVARLLDKNFDAIVAFGCVIRGETAHFDFVAGHASDGLGALAKKSATPILFGVLTTENHEQAVARADRAQGNKGYEVMLGALEMIALFEQIKQISSLRP